MRPVVKASRVRGWNGTPLWRLELDCGHMAYRSRWELGNPMAPHWARCLRCPLHHRRKAKRKAKAAALGRDPREPHGERW
jgi:hypothetical protein